MVEILAAVKNFSMELDSPRREMVFFAIPKETQGIRGAFEETLTWEWVAQNTPELEGDSIARRELAARRLAAQERLERAVARCFETASSYRASYWVLAGNELVFASARQLSARFSAVCDAVYDQSPIVHNELINRRSLSSAAAAARRQLIELMLKNGDQQRLGIEKFPPEVSLYLSVLHRSGLHHCEGETWTFGLEAGEDPTRVIPLWKTIDSFLDTTETKARAVPELYAILQKPPYGIKEGLLPIYLVVAILVWGRELAVYEEGRFVPNMGIAECERLLRAPERFTLQRYRLDESRKQMLYEYATLFDESIDPAEVNPVMAVRPLLSLIKQLPKYTQLTSRLSPGAIAMRDTLFAAREPQPLLFKSLPDALGFPSHIEDGQAIHTYFARLKSVVAELQLAYQHLLQQIEKQLFNALLLPSDVETARTEIAGRCQILTKWVSDLRLKAFVQRLGDAESLQRDWIESVAALVANTPPYNWNDKDVLRFDVALTGIAEQLRRTEEVALSRPKGENKTEAVRVARLAVTDLKGSEWREVVQISEEQEAEVQSLVDALRKTLKQPQISRATRLMAVTELASEILSETAPANGSEK